MISRSYIAREIYEKKEERKKINSVDHCPRRTGGYLQMNQWEFEK